MEVTLSSKCASIMLHGPAALPQLQPYAMFLPMPVHASIVHQFANLCAHGFLLSLGAVSLLSCSSFLSDPPNTSFTWSTIKSP